MDRQQRGSTSGPETNVETQGREERCVNSGTAMGRVVEGHMGKLMVWKGTELGMALYFLVWASGQAVEPFSERGCLEGAAGLRCR